MSAPAGFVAITTHRLSLSRGRLLDVSFFFFVYVFSVVVLEGFFCDDRGVAGVFDSSAVQQVAIVIGAGRVVNKHPYCL